MIALREGIYRTRKWGGGSQRLVLPDHDAATTRTNDGKADPRGRFWAAIYARAMRCRQSSAFLMDCRSARASALELKAGNALIANGLAWSPDAAIVYGADTPSQTVRA